METSAPREASLGPAPLCSGAGWICEKAHYEKPGLTCKGKGLHHQSLASCGSTVEFDLHRPTARARRRATGLRPLNPGEASLKFFSLKFSLSLSLILGRKFSFSVSFSFSFFSFCSFFSLKFSNLQLSLELLRDGHLDLGLLVLLGVAAQEEFEKGTF
jgi:hypothetical protein